MCTAQIRWLTVCQVKHHEWHTETSQELVKLYTHHASHSSLWGWCKKHHTWGTPSLSSKVVGAVPDLMKAFHLSPIQGRGYAHTHTACLGSYDSFSLHSECNLKGLSTSTLTHVVSTSPLKHVVSTLPFKCWTTEAASELNANLTWTCHIISHLCVSTHLYYGVIWCICSTRPESAVQWTTATDQW